MLFRQRVKRCTLVVLDCIEYLGIKTGSPDMICHILSYRVDLHDPHAVAEATKQDSAVFELLLPEHATRYPKGRAGSGTDVLKMSYLLVTCHCPRGYSMQARMRTTPLGYAIGRHRGAGIKFVEHLLQQKRKNFLQS